MQTQEEMEEVDRKLEAVLELLVNKHYEAARMEIGYLRDNVGGLGYQAKWYEQAWYQQSVGEYIRILGGTYAHVLDLIAGEEFGKADEELKHLQVTLKRDWFILKGFKDSGPLGRLKGLFG